MIVVYQAYLRPERECVFFLKLNQPFRALIAVIECFFLRCKKIGPGRSLFLFCQKMWRNFGISMESEKTIPLRCEFSILKDHEPS